MVEQGGPVKAQINVYGDTDLVALDVVAINTTDTGIYIKERSGTEHYLYGDLSSLRVEFTEVSVAVE